jgi:hypothetical protein
MITNRISARLHEFNTGVLPPLIDELKEMPKGLKAYDSYKK